MRSQVRITNRDLKLYGYTSGCPRCDDLEHGKSKTHKEHSDECRLRMYLTWQTNGDPKSDAVRHILEPDAPRDDPDHVKLDDGSHRRSQIPDRVEEQPRTPTARPWEFNSLDRANAADHHAPAPTSASRLWAPQSFRDDEQFELDSLYSPGSPDETMEGIAPHNVPDNDEMLDTLMMM